MTTTRSRRPETPPLGRWLRGRTPALFALTLALPLLLMPLPARAAKAAAAGAATAAAPVDLNSASQKELEALPGVGAATAKKIVAGRPYTSVADLAKAGVPKKTIDKIGPLVTVGAAPAATAAPPATPAAAAGKTASKGKAAATAASGAKVDVNTASQKELEALPGVGAATAKKIIAGRPYTSVADLAKAGVSAKQMEKIGPLVTVSTPVTTAASSSPAATPTPAPAPAPKAGRTATASTRAPAQPPPAPGMVWVNLDTRVFHRSGDPWYGNTKHGQYMTEAAALAAGYREAKKGGKKAPAAQ